MVPLFEPIKPEITFNKVLFPAPFAPTRVTISPSLTSTDTSCKT